MLAGSDVDEVVEKKEGSHCQWPAASENERAKSKSYKWRFLAETSHACVSDFTCTHLLMKTSLIVCLRPDVFTLHKKTKKNSNACA